MKFMVMVRATPETESESGPEPAASEDLVHEMMAYNRALMDAGVLLAGDGLQPSRNGARVRFDGDARTVIDGPFAESKELIAGYWMFECASLQEAIDWVKKCPNPTGPDSVIEIRPVYGAEAFSESAQDEIREMEQRLAQKNEGAAGKV